MRTKLAVVDRLRQDMRAHCQQAAGDAASHAWVQGAYEIFCDAFKTYLLSYDGATDVRFFPTAAVPTDSVLVKQGSSHWKAGGGGGRLLVCVTVQGFSSRRWQVFLVETEMSSKSTGTAQPLCSRIPRRWRWMGMGAC